MDIVKSAYGYNAPLEGEITEIDMEDGILAIDDFYMDLEFVINNLNSMNIDNKCYELDLTIARGLDYYTGTVYETRLVDYPGIGSVCSGGRYDDLASYYTDKKLPGVGISIGLTRLFYQLMEAGIIKSEESSVSDVTILPMTENYEYVYKVSSIFRKNNIKVDICYLDKFKQLMRYADRQKTPFVIIIGDNEIEKEVVTIKNMVTGEQIEASIDSMVEEYFNLKK